MCIRDSIKSGGKTPVSGMIHAVTLLAVLLFAAPLAQHIPLAVLAAILAGAPARAVVTGT